jgi:hypothetical protein
LVKSFLPAALLDMAKAMLSWSGRQPHLPAAWSLGGVVRP